MKRRGNEGTMKDYELVELFWQRNETALDETKKTYGKYCMYIAENILFNRQDSEECLNDVLLSAWKSIPPEKPGNLKTYLGRLARIISIDVLRKKNAAKRIPDRLIIPIDELVEVFGNSEVESASEEKELSRLISQFLRSCREEERNIFIRRYWYYDSIDRICSRYGLGKSKVLVTLKRTRDKLALFLKGEGYSL